MLEYPVHPILVWLMENEALSTVLVHCKGEEKKENVATKFRDLFAKNWKKAEKDTIREVDVDFKTDPEYYPTINDGIDSLSEVRTVDEGVLISFDPLDIPYCYGEFCEIEKPCQAVEDTFAQLASAIRGVSYDGFIAFPWSDRRCGDIEEYSFSNASNERENDDTVMKYVWGKITAALEVEAGDEDGDMAYAIGQEIDCADLDDVFALIDCIYDAAKKGYLSEAAKTHFFNAILNSDLDSDDKEEVEEMIEDLQTS